MARTSREAEAKKEHSKTFVRERSPAMRFWSVVFSAAEFAPSLLVC